MNSFYLVSGMHRSGTSLVAALLHNNGIDMGEGHFKPKPDKDNPIGYFEDSRFRAINDRLLKFSGYDVKDWNVNIPSVNDNKRLRGQIRGVLGQSRGSKDPRFCLTWPMWYQHLPKDTLVVIVYRNPESVANSMIKRGNIKKEGDGHRLWKTYNERLLPIRKHFETVLVKYEDVLLARGIPELGIDDEHDLIKPKLNRNKAESVPDSCQFLWQKLTTLKNSEKG